MPHYTISQVRSIAVQFSFFVKVRYENKIILVLYKIYPEFIYIKIYIKSMPKFKYAQKYNEKTGKNKQKMGLQDRK